MEAKRQTQTTLLIILALAVALFLLFSARSLANYLELASLSLSFPYQIDYGEGPLLDQVMRLSNVEPIYSSDFSTPPYTISNYPPVFLLIQVPFAWLFGPAFWYGRLISLLSAVLAALFLGLTLHALTDDWLASLAGGLLLLAYPYVQFWSVLNRIDLLALALSWAGIFTAVRWKDRRWGIPLAAAFLVGSIFTRQSYAAAGPFAVFIWLLAERRMKAAVRLALFTGGASLVLFLLMNIFTGGGFYMNIVVANVNPFFWEIVKNYAETFARNSIALLILAGVFFFLERFFKHTRSWPLALAYGTAAAAVATTVGKDGSNVNYMLEVTAGLCFAAGASMAWLGRGVWMRLAVLAVLVFQLNTLHAWTLSDFNGRITEKTDYETNMARLAQIVREASGSVLIDEEMGLVPLTGKRLYFQPFEYKMLADGGLWDENLLVQEIRDKKFALIVQYDSVYWPSLVSRWTPRVLSAVRSSYRIETTIGSNHIYRPRE